MADRTGRRVLADGPGSGRWRVVREAGSGRAGRSLAPGAADHGGGLGAGRAGEIARDGRRPTLVAGSGRVATGQVDAGSGALMRLRVTGSLVTFSPPEASM
jgi:hypothetical protein